MYSYNYNNYIKYLYLNRCIYTILNIIEGVEKKKQLITVSHLFRQVNKQKREIINQRKIKAVSLPRKQNKNISQNNKKFIKNVAASGFGIVKWIMNYYF